MARRMFSTDIVESDQFLDMGQGAQNLYFHLGMKADDDGFVNPKSIMRMLGIADDEMKVLLAKRFLLPFESGVVVVKHWLIHNLIRADLYKETQYKKEKSMLGLNENGAYTELRDGVAEIKQIEAPKWLKQRRKEQRNADVPQTALRLGKERLGKDKTDNKKEVELPDWLDKTKWQEWIAYRKERRLTCTPTTLTKQIKLLGENQSTHVAMIEKSITNGWQGLFPVNGGGGAKKTNALVDEHTQNIINSKKNNTVDLS